MTNQHLTPPELTVRPPAPTAGDLGDLARLFGSNPEALRRKVKSMLDAGMRIPGVARDGRRYRVHIEAFTDAWAKGDIHLAEVLPCVSRGAGPARRNK